MESPNPNETGSANEPKKAKVPFADYLRSLADPATRLLVADLKRLSALDRGALAAFRATWPSIPTERRRQILLDLDEIAEDSVELDFTTVLRVCLADADEDVRVLAASGLWEDQDPGTALGLLDRLARDESPRVRAAAAESLGGFVYRIEMKELSRTLAGKVRDGLLAVLRNESEPLDVRRRALESVGYLSEPEVRDLITRAFADENERMRASAVFAMGRNASPDWLETIWKEMGSDSPELRFEAARAAGEIEDERSIRPLVSLLTDDDHEVRLAAITALGKIGGEQAIRALRFLSEQSEDADTKEAAGEALEEALGYQDPLDV